MELSSQLQNDPVSLVGLVMPIIIAIIVQSGMSSSIKSMVALLSCGVVTALVNLQQGDAVSHGIGGVLVTTLVAYKMFYHPSGLSDKIETMTNLPLDE